MGKRNRNRTKLVATPAEYRDAEGNLLVLRGSLPAGARVEYAEVLSGGLHREDARQRAIELLFERLALSWTIAGVTLGRQRELIERYRVATGSEREFVLGSLRTHAADYFPELEAP